VLDYVFGPSAQPRNLRDVLLVWFSTDFILTFSILAGLYLLVTKHSGRRQLMIGFKRCPLIRWFLLACLIASPAFAQQPLLQITSPVNQALVSEGQTITITVSADPSVQISMYGAILLCQRSKPTSDPTKFTLALPTNITRDCIRLPRR